MFYLTYTKGMIEAGGQAALKSFRNYRHAVNFAQKLEEDYVIVAKARKAGAVLSWFEGTRGEVPHTALAYARDKLPRKLLKWCERKCK